MLFCRLFGVWWSKTGSVPALRPLKQPLSLSQPLAVEFYAAMPWWPPGQTMTETILPIDLSVSTSNLPHPFMYLVTRKTTPITHPTYPTLAITHTNHSLCSRLPFRSGFVFLNLNYHRPGMTDKKVGPSEAKQTVGRASDNVCI